jgi:hypothetical protein
MPELGLMYTLRNGKDKYTDYSKYRQIAQCQFCQNHHNSQYFVSQPEDKLKQRILTKAIAFST